ncbi:dicarboxylate/amino acid:cation symporter [uncultured Oscillibacter sp.]|uniref:dicarboxylate/amino acid:cation symporter n=1 Tax=uncultured Oscillibacter sp. TaxID=876091 RepID=UPI0025ED4184|nr:dicarboxylate/amino acid:cation symporter [uncultured Oscillibacter sp.]
MKAWKKVPLYIKIFILMLLGAIVGYIVGPDIAAVAFLGNIYIALLKMLVVPLVFFSLVCGVTQLADPKEFGKLGGSIMVYYLTTTLFAAAAGVVLALIVSPGADAEGILGMTEEVTYTEYSLGNTILSWIPQNIVSSMANMDMIPVIVFAILFGLCLVMIGDKKKPIVDFFDAGNEAMLKMTGMVMEIAPYGIFFLTANMVGTIGTKMLIVGAKFVLADYCGLLLMLVVVYPLLLKLVGKLSPLQFYKNASPAMIMAAGTTSSNATLPVSMSCAGENMGINEKLYGFSLPLGATVNMDGFSVALGIISVTALQLYGVDLTPAIILKAVFMGLVLSIGAPGVKGTAVVMSAVLFQALGLPMGMLPLIGAIWPVVDIGHTCTNVTSDIVGAAVVGSKLGLMDKDVFYAKNKKA